MIFNPRILCSVAVIGITCMVSAAAYYYKACKEEINEVMVFCKLQFNVFNSFDRLMSFVDNAKKKIDVCMPSIHNPAIQGRLLNAVVLNKIKLRIIIDRNGYRESTEFFIRELVKAGAEIKCRVSDPCDQQHKFCVIDGKILLTGTLNWGDDRTSDDWNYVYITNKTELVEPIKKNFEQIWSNDLVLEVAWESTHAVSESDESESPEIVDKDDINSFDFENEANQTVIDNDADQTLREDMLRLSQLTNELCLICDQSN